MQTPVQAEAMLGDAIKRAEEVDVAFLDSQRLEGDFSETGAKRLVSALEAMLPHFDLVGEAGKVQGELLEEGRLGPDLTRKLLYVVDAINDAVDDSILSAEMECDLETIRRDEDLTYLAGKIRRAASDRGFRRWLEEEIEEEEEERAEMMASKPAEEEDGAEALFMARM